MFNISQLPLLSGLIGICPMPGRFSCYEINFEIILDWCPKLVITVAQFSEMERTGIAVFPNDLKANGIGWMHFPVADYGVPEVNPDGWGNISSQAHKILNAGGRVLCHCHAGCGRSGMVLLRLMCETGETASDALARLRKIRSCAIETEAQRVWATQIDR